MKKDDLFNLASLTAIVTGGASGIGKECSKLFSLFGANVIIADRDLIKAQKSVDEINELKKGKAIAVECDVTDDESLKNLVDETIKAFGKINILVNVAGGGGGGTENPFKITVEYMERIYKLNVFSPWRLIQLTAPYMKKSGYGSIINISSMASIDKAPNMSIYASSKAALNHLTSNLAYDLGEMGIRINNVGPGATRTPALETVLTPELEKKMLTHTPIKRLGLPLDIAGAVLYFASPISEWISGQTIFVNGGGDQTLY